MSPGAKEFMDKIRPKSRPIKHGLYTKIQIKRVDGRTKLGKYVQELRKRFTEDLGGQETLSIQQQTLVDDVLIPQLLQIKSYNTRTFDPEFETSFETAKYFVALCNSARLTLCALGLQKKEPEPLDLKKYLAQKASGEIKPDLHETGETIDGKE